MKNTNKETVECPYCNGKGRLDHLTHIADGVCFTCRGTGKLEITGRASSQKVRDAIAAAKFRDAKRNSKYILTGDMTGDIYSDDLAHLAAICEDARSQVKWGDPKEAVQLLHRDGRKVTVGEVKAVRK